ncbi:MAG: SDR family oxidoreductase [Candidatus Acetothermia bacterium]|jgi:3-oxoacyl-[acyl-carrier protein] reductase|nr:SDR family oxidoreductase [Candidatus Acetothermia bacterium]MDH7505343.1 SDR family oxidoreductase [Candidatus Acetothermia bacterium]
METGLKDKVVLITGASGGIGQATARAFAEEGAKLVLHGHSRMAELESLRRELPVETIAVRADLTKEGEVERLFREAYSRFGRLEVLVANAGIWPEEARPLHKMSLERWERTIAADQTSVFLCAREFFRLLERTRPEAASLIIVGSTAAVFGEEGHADYAAAKAAITYGLTRSLKNEIIRIIPRGRVNAVCPGWTLTRMASGALRDPSAVVRALQTRALKRIARPEEVARAIVFLASDRLAGHITGEILTVSGGMEGRVLHLPEEIDPRAA